jgi:hypothetical protein
MDPEAAEIEAAEVERKRIASLIRADLFYKLMRGPVHTPQTMKSPELVFHLTHHEVRVDACKARILAGIGCCGACCNNTRQCHCAGVLVCSDCIGGVCPGCE